MSEGPTLKGESVIIVGGANSAGQAAIHFSSFAKKVTLVVRGPSLQKSMSQYLIDQIGERANIEVRTNSTVTGLEGESRLQQVAIKEPTKPQAERIPGQAMFVFIGAEPRTKWLSGSLKLDVDGFVLTGPEAKPESGWDLPRDPLPFETSVPGVFAVGDVRSGSMKRIASAAGEGANAVSFVHKYLATTPKPTTSNPPLK